MTENIAATRTVTSRFPTAAAKAIILNLIVIFMLAVRPTPVDAQPGPGDMRFILQTQGGLTAYTELPSPISLLHARQLLAAITVENDEFVYGDYFLAGQTYSVKLDVGTAGWIIAFHPPDYALQRLLDCATHFDINHIIGRPERAVLEVALALGHSDPLIDFYDGRFPEATNITLHWLYIAQTGHQAATLTLPLANLYLERGYAFCTALTNSEFSLNGEFLERVGAVSQIIRRWNPLRPDQLRAGQSNALATQALSLFGTGFLAGVSVVYEGDVPLTASGGYARSLALAYPPMLGEPLDINRVYLPMTVR